MKKIILAPAVALAFTGLVANPVAAAESTSAQSASTQTAEQKRAEADKAKKEEAEKAAAEKAAAEKAEAEKKAAAEKAAAEKKAKEKAEAAKKAADKKKADEKKAAEDKADEKDEAKTPPKKVDPKPAPAPKDEDKDAKDDDKSEDKANPINASVQVTSGAVTAEELAEDGVTVKVSGLEKGDKVSAKSGLTGPATTAQGSSATLKLRSAKDAESLTSGKQSLAVQVQRTNAPTATESTSFSYTPYSASDVDPTVSLNADEFTQSEFDKNGVEVTGEGFTPNGTVTVVGGDETSPFATQEVEADDEGKVSATLKFEGDGELPAGDYSVWGVDQESKTNSPAQDFTITEDETEAPSTPAEEAKLTVSPESITPADFVKEDKGVTLAVENCEPGEDVRFLVNPKGESSVTAFDKTVQADDEGKANVNVYGTSASNASAYIGDYDVTVTCGDDELTGDFSVEDDPNAGGGDGDEDGNDDGDNGDAGNGGDLPRTGTELTGLVGGAGLLLIGGVAVAMTMRRKKVAQDPAEI